MEVPTTTVRIDGQPSWNMLVDIVVKGQDEVRRELADLFLTFNNDVYQNVPAGLTVNTHVCRGNFHSTWASSGGYAPIAKELLGEEAVNAYFLEFDTDRAGGFEPLAEVTPGKVWY